MAKRSLAGLVVVGASLVALAAVSFASPGARTSAHRQAAGRVADQLLASVVLPPGSVKVPSEPAGDAHQLARPVFGMFFAAEIERHGFWRTSATPTAVIASFTAHPPAGAKPLGTGSGGGGAFAAYRLGPGRAYSPGLRQVVVDAVALANGETGVRADAEVRYAARRTPSQQVPRSARVLQVTMGGQGAAPSLSLTITRRSRLRAIAAMVDSLPFVSRSPGAFACPFFGDPVDTFIFRASSGGRVLARVSESAYTPVDASPCALTFLTIRGHHEPGLMDGGVLLLQAGRLLGVKLTGPASRP